MSDLFRIEAVAARQNRWTGDPAAIRPVSAWVPTLFLFSIAVIGIVFLFVGSYTRKEHVTGVVIAAEGVVRLRAPESAVIASLAVHDGQHVEAGDVLAVLTRERYGPAGATSALVDRSLREQREQVLRQAREQQAAATASAAGLNDRIDRAARDLRHLDEEIRLQSEMIASAERVVANMKPLADERIISDLQYQQQVNQLLDYRGRLETQKRTREGLLAEQKMAEAERRSLHAKSSADFAGAERTRLALEQDRLQRSTESTLQLRAPIAGTVTSLTGIVGQRVEPTSQIAAIVPADSHMQAVLYVPSTAVGFVHKGSTVAVRYDAFPFEKFGQYHGRVVEVSGTDVPLADWEAPPPATKDKTLYRVRVALDRQAIDAYGTAVPLRPGLTLAADIQLDRRRLIEWMFDPLFAMAKRL